ncbi:hypothetical protein HDV00_001125 [Rhizophlyctis rosea]|nr:hypothetical protein HDV00_001125 [Rhizophlyctis rosea]
MAETGIPSHWDEIIPSDVGLRHVHGAYLFLGLLVLVFGLFSHFIKDRLFSSEAFVATMLGIIVSPVALNLWNSQTEFGSGEGGGLDKFTLELSRVILCIQCMAAGVNLPGKYLAIEKQSLMILLGPIMVGMWIFTSLGVKAVMGLSWAEAFIIGGCLTPTDPILANSIIEGRFAERHVPLRLRQILSAESAANDGLGLPFVLLPVYLMRLENGGVAFGDWLYKVVVYQIVLSFVLGLGFGYVARKALKASQRHGLIDQQNILSFSVAIAVALMGVLSLMGADDILACFVAGSAFTWDMWFNQQIQDSHIQTIIDSLLNLTYFVFFGTRIPWVEIGNLGAWKLVALAVWILILRRLPVTMLLHQWIPAVTTVKEAFFLGWFGPVGASAIFYAMLLIVYFGFEESPVWPIVSFIVLASVIIHGATVSLFHIGLVRHSTYQSWREGGHPSMTAIRAAIWRLRLPSAIGVELGSGRMGDGSESEARVYKIDVEGDGGVGSERTSVDLVECPRDEVGTRRVTIIDEGGVVAGVEAETVISPDGGDVRGGNGGSEVVEEAR